jgi:hypothetical protein
MAHSQPWAAVLGGGAQAGDPVEKATSSAHVFAGQCAVAVAKGNF